MPQVLHLGCEGRPKAAIRLPVTQQRHEGTIVDSRTRTLVPDRCLGYVSLPWLLTASPGGRATIQNLSVTNALSSVGRNALRAGVYL